MTTTSFDPDLAERFAGQIFGHYIGGLTQLGLKALEQRYAVPLYSYCRVALDGQLTVNPGGQSITVVFTMGL